MTFLQMRVFPHLNYRLFLLLFLGGMGSLSSTDLVQAASLPARSKVQISHEVAALMGKAVGAIEVKGNKRIEKDAILVLKEYD